MGAPAGSVNTRWWIAAGVIALLFTAATAIMMQRAFTLELRLLPETARLAPTGIAFLVALLTALPWGLYLFSAVIAAIVVRRRSVPPPAILDVLAVAICAQAAALLSCLLNARNLAAAERELNRHGDAVSADAIFALLEPGLVSDLLSTVGVALLFGVLLRIRYPHLRMSTLVLASLAPIAVTALMLAFSLLAR